MQKVFIAVVLALTLSFAAAGYTLNEAGFVKKPVTVCADNETACVNVTNMKLGGLSTSDVTLISYDNPTEPSDKNTSAYSWKVFTRKISAKDLSATGNTTYSFTAPQLSSVAYGYAVLATSEKVNNVSQIFLYQTKLEGATVLPRVQLTANTNSTFEPVLVGFTILTKSLVGFALVADKKVNVSSVTLGGSTLGKETTLTTNYLGGKVQAINGEALSSSVLALWTEGDTLKQSVVDTSKGTATTGNVGNYNKTLHTSCEPFTTDKKLYGALCSGSDNATAPLNVYVAVLSNSSGLVKLTEVAGANGVDAIPYGGYVALMFSSLNISATGATLTSYKSIWDLDASKAILNNTQFLTADTASSTADFYRIPAGGVYVLAFDNRANTTVGNTNVKVGLLLGGSYLSTVFGSLLAIIAGLLLF